MKGIVQGCGARCRRRFLKVIIPCGLFLVSSLGLLAQPIVDFIADQTSVCAGSTVTFTDLTDNISGEAIYSWNFGNGAVPATITGEGPHVVRYSIAGSVTVTLSVTDEAGTDEEAKTDYITVEGVAHFLSHAQLLQSSSQLIRISVWQLLITPQP